MLEHSKKEIILKDEIEENTLAIYLEDEPINYIPDRESGYTLDMTKSSCNNGVTISFDYNTWSVKTNYSNYTNTDNTRVKCSLYFTDKYIEPILNGTDPILEDPLIPVTISDDGTVRKADLASEWYDYETKQWANAVILFDETKTYASGDVIPEDAIESYFVWIPKYRYQLWDLGLYDSMTEIDTNKIHEIPVIFGDYNTSDSVSGECTTPMESGASGNCRVGDYMTHPAFLSIPSTGFWVGKFETGYEGATTVTEAEQNVRNASQIQIKPNVYSWRRIQIANAFYTSYDYQRNLDSHMMKNTEWGAVAYLEHSTYGSATSVRQNNNSDFITGYQANENTVTSCNDYTCNSAYPNSVLASTTGNITGVFDMAGGSWDYVMGVIMDKNGDPISGASGTKNSGFNGPLGCSYKGDDEVCLDDTTSLTEVVDGYNWPSEKYIDFYNYNTKGNQHYALYNRILGDATGETGPYEIGSATGTFCSWENIISMTSQIYSWFSRGYDSYYNNYAVSLTANSQWGGAYSNTSFRIILTPTGVSQN